MRRTPVRNRSYGGRRVANSHRALEHRPELTRPESRQPRPVLDSSGLDQQATRKATRVSATTAAACTSIAVERAADCARQGAVRCRSRQRAAAFRAQANMAVCRGAAGGRHHPGMNLAHGGHLTHAGHPLNFGQALHHRALRRSGK